MREHQHNQQEDKVIKGVEPLREENACCSSGQCAATHASEHHHSSEACSVDKHAPELVSEEVLPPPAGSQRFSWLIGGMDCPSCARKIENAVSAIPGVDSAKVLFATEKLVVDAQTDISQIVLQEVKKVGFTLSSTAKTAEKPAPESWAKRYGLLILLVILMLISWGVSTIDPVAGNAAFLATTLVGLFPIVRQSIQLIRTGTPFAIETLMSVAAIGAIFIGATAEAAMVLLLFMVGELLESYAASRARSGISALMELVPEEALLLRDGQRIKVSVQELRPGDIIEVAPGARLPTDAELVTEFASFDESALTGESIPVEHQSGDKVSAGCLVVDNVSQMRVTSQPGSNAIDRILKLIEEADERRAPIERFLDKFSRYYTPAIMLFSLLTVLIPPLLFSQPWETWIYRGLTLLLIGCPCALVISTPAAITSGLAAATRNGALIKGGAALEQLGTIRNIAFDKTGTLTEGKPTVTDIMTADDVSQTELLSWSAAVESGSHHPLAIAVVARAQQESIALIDADERRAIPGVGVQGSIDGKIVLLSSPVKTDPAMLSDTWSQAIHKLESEGKTVVVVLREERVAGLLALRDTLRKEAKEALTLLRGMGIKGVMLTGDNPRAAAAIASELNIDYRASLLPEDKVAAITELAKIEPIAMVGDGINDAPAMKAANIGIAMGGGTDVALETADAALSYNSLHGLVKMIQISRDTHLNIRQNITIALGLKAVFLVTSLLGLTGLWLAVLADSGATALVTANALRLLRKR